jgi:hypothetical protein
MPIERKSRTLVGNNPHSRTTPTVEAYKLLRFLRLMYKLDIFDDELHILPLPHKGQKTWKNVDIYGQNYSEWYEVEEFEGVEPFAANWKSSATY